MQTPSPPPHQKSWGGGGKSQAWRSHITGLPLTAWVNLGTKPNLWGHWMSADMGLASGGGWGTSTVRVSKLLSTTHIITAQQTPAYTWPLLCSIWCLSFISFWHFSPRTSAEWWGQLSFLPAIPQGLWKWFNCSSNQKKKHILMNT